MKLEKADPSMLGRAKKVRTTQKAAFMHVTLCTLQQQSRYHGLGGTSG
jgi:hypothetical protein